MSGNFAVKLRLSALVLGCSGRKDLCARFRAINPATQFDIDRAHKWMQGRAVPRSPQVYADLARVLGSARSGTWLAECSLEAFCAEIGSIFGVDGRALLRQVDAGPDAAVTEAPPAEAPARFDLSGTYACYSHAWSPYYRGQVIRGSLTIGAARRGTRETAYAERLLGGIVRFEGEMSESAHGLHVLLRGPGGVSPLFLSLSSPAPPGSMLCGMMTGATTVGPIPMPSATRLVAVRVPADATETNRYLPAEDGALAADLVALGLDMPDPAEAERALRTVLVPARTMQGLDQIAVDDMTTLAMAFDVIWLGRARLPSLETT